MIKVKFFLWSLEFAINKCYCFQLETGELHVTSSDNAIYITYIYLEIYKIN